MPSIVQASSLAKSLSLFPLQSIASHESIYNPYLIHSPAQPSPAVKRPPVVLLALSPEEVMQSSMPSPYTRTPSRKATIHQTLSCGKMKGSSSSSSSSSSWILGLSDPSPDAPDLPTSSATLCVESRDRTCGACVKARDGDEDVDRPGTFDKRRLGGVLDVCISEEALISSASCALGSRIMLYLARLTVLSREAGRERMGRSFTRSSVVMNEAMESSSETLLDCAGMPGLPDPRNSLSPSSASPRPPERSFDDVLPRPELVLLSAVLLDGIRLLRFAKLLL